MSVGGEECGCGGGSPTAVVPGGRELGPTEGPIAGSAAPAEVREWGGSAGRCATSPSFGTRGMLVLGDTVRPCTAAVPAAAAADAAVVVALARSGCWEDTASASLRAVACVLKIGPLLPSAAPPDAPTSVLAAGGDDDDGDDGGGDCCCCWWWGGCAIQASQSPPHLTLGLARIPAGGTPAV
jgi:hypothetical protein